MQKIVNKTQMSKNLQTFLTLLRKRPIHTANVVNFLEKDDTASLLGLDGIIGSISSFMDNELPDDIIENLIKNVEVTINQQKDLAEQDMNALIIANNFNNYQEIVTSVEEDISDITIINDYEGKVNNNDLEYFVLHSPLPNKSFTIGKLFFEISPMKSIPFTMKDGNKSFISYKFMVKITCPSNNSAVIQNFNNFRLDVFLHVIGMSFLKQNDITFVKNVDLITMEINTFNFYEELALKYNLYYGNLKRLDEIKLTELSGIECCQIDSNGLILVPKLFYMSSIYTDGDIGTRPFIYSPNEGLPSLPFTMNRYKISISGTPGVSEKEFESAVNSLIKKMANFGVNLSIDQNRKKAKNINLSILGYNSYTEDNGEFQSEWSSKFNLESKVSAAFRKLCQHDIIGLQNYGNRGINNSIGSEKYSFIYNSTKGDIESNYDFNSNKFMIYYDRSSVYLSLETDGQAAILVKAINDRNDSKFKNTGIMIQSLEEKGQRLEYGGKIWQTSPSDYIPTSFVPLIISKREGEIEKKFIGINFIPFGFAKYVNIDPNLSLNETGFTIYGSDIEITPISIRKVLKLSMNSSKVTNINQIIFETNVSPKFVGNQPLKVSKLDADHFICLFRSTSKIQPIDSNIKWTYVSDYMQNTNFIQTEMNTSKTLTFILNGDEILNVSKRSILRYFIESMGFVSDFNTIVFNNLETIFGSSDYISLENFLDKFISDENKMSIDTNGYLSQEFFSFLKLASSKGIVNDNTINYISSLLKIPDSNDLTSIKNFINSIKNPIKDNKYPIFNTEIQMNITNQINEEINSAVNSVYQLYDKLIDKTAVEIFSVATSKEGILRTLIELIAKSIEKSGNSIASSSLITEFKNTSILYLKSLINSPILPELIDTEITPKFIMNVAEKLNKVPFYEFIKLLNGELSVSNYEDIIMKLCKSVTSENENFIITSISPHKYSVTFNDLLSSIIIESLNDTFIDSIGLNLSVIDGKTHINEFGEYDYDSNIHIMFEVSYPETKNVNDVIFSSVSSGSIYYSQINDTFILPELNIISLHEPPIEINGRYNVKFFLPFTFNGGKLTVDKISWNDNESEFKLLNKTVEVELSLENINNYQTAIKRLIYESLIDISNSNLQAVKSLLMGLNPVKKGYIIEGKQSHYFFTEDLNMLISSGSYTEEINTISSEFWSMISSDKLSIFIHPVPSIICKFYLIMSGIDGEIIKPAGKALKLSVSKTKFEVETFINNFRNYFSDDFKSSSNQKDTILITRNNKGIYTSNLGTRGSEIQIANGINSYNESLLTIDNIDNINEIEILALKEQINAENDKLYLENTKHNLSLMLSTVKWNSKQIENYRFFSDEKPKWMKFSKDSMFMAIGFQGGTKIYIKSANQYVFCSNLHHEGISNIFFGNNNLCVTLQYQNQDKPFGKLWIISAGIQISVALDFYRVVDGDAANVKYISNTSNKEKKNVIINVVNNKVMYGNIPVQSVSPIFDHNVFFFSPNDSYFIYNSKGTFKVLDMNTLKEIEFSSNVALIKPFEYGTWLDEKHFVCITYHYNLNTVKQKVILNFDKMTATQSPLLSEFPNVTNSNSMVIDGYTKSNPIYNYLIKEKENISKYVGNGFWIYDLYVSLSYGENETYINFNTLDGGYSSYRISDIKYDLDQLIIIMKIWIFDTITDEYGIHVENITWIDRILFIRSECDYSGEYKLSNINGNYFCFNNDDIFIWSYQNNGKTELIHIDSDGYEKMIFDKYVAVIINSVLKVAEFQGDSLIMIDININHIVEHNRNPLDITSIVEPIRQKFQTKILAYTETTMEIYSSIESQPLVIDSRIISSALCLNRFPNYTLKSHSESNNSEIYETYDNLLINCQNNVVSIIPKTVQISNNIDGFVSDWYKNQDENWEEKKLTIENYLSKAYEFFPQLKGLMPIEKLDYEFIKDKLKYRNESNFEMGIKEFISYEWSEYLIDTFRKIFAIMKKVNFIYSPMNLVEEVKNYWTIKSNNGPFGIYMNSIPEDEREIKYSKAIDVFKVLAGDNFISYKVGMVFKMINESQFTTSSGVRKLKSIETFRFQLNSQMSNLDLETRDRVKLILFVLDIPYINFIMTEISTFNDYMYRISVLKDELSKITKMTEKTNRYDKYRSLELDDLVSNHDKFLKRYMSYNTKTFPNQSEPDFILCLKTKYEISKIPFETFGFADTMIHNGFFYVKDSTNKVYNEISEEMYHLSLFVETIKDLYKNIKLWFYNNHKDSNISNIVAILGGRNIKSHEDQLNILKNKLNQYLDDSMKNYFQENEINKAKAKLIEDLIFINNHNKNFNSLKDLFNFLDQVYKERFPESLYTYFNEIPEYAQEIFANYNRKISDDSNLIILEYNIPYIEDMFNFYSSSLKRGTYVSNNYYDKDMIEIKNCLTPLLWLYRNGVTDNKIPVTNIKIIFDRPVKFKAVEISKQNEKNDLTFEYEIPENERIHGEKYGIIKVNLVNLLKKFKDKSNVISDYTTLQAFKGFIDNINVIKSATENNLINDIKAKGMIVKFLPKVEGNYETLDDYKNLIHPKYYNTGTILNGKESGKNFIKLYSRANQMTISDLEIKYFFDYMKAGIDFGNEKISMKYESAKSSIVDPGVDLSKSNFSIGSFRPSLFDPKLVLQSNGKPYEYIDSQGDKLIVYYGNTSIDKVNHGVIVTQRLKDRKMSTYLYYKHMKFPDGRSKQLDDVGTYINSIIPSDDGNIDINEKYDDRKFDSGKYVNVQIDNTFRSNISSLTNQWTIQEEIDENRFKDSVITANKTITKGRLTAILSNYKTGRFFGSIIEIYEMKEDKIEIKANLNFNLIDIKNFDFNNEQLVIIGTTNSWSGYNVRIGIMNLDKDYGKNSIFINNFDKEIKLVNSSINSVDNCNVTCGIASYVTYKDDKMNNLVIINKYKNYQNSFDTDITSVRVSKESGYVALYFDKKDITEIWSASGSLYKIVNGECNWM